MVAFQSTGHFGQSHQALVYVVTMGRWPMNLTRKKKGCIDRAHVFIGGLLDFHDPAINAGIHS